MMNSKPEVGYDAQGGNGQTRCENCMFFIEPSACRMVSGNINEDGICNLFEMDTYKTASEYIADGFLDKLAELTGGTQVSNRVIIEDAEVLKDPAMKGRVKRQSANMRRNRLEV